MNTENPKSKILSLFTSYGNAMYSQDADRAEMIYERLTNLVCNLEISDKKTVCSEEKPEENLNNGDKSPSNSY